MVQNMKVIINSIRRMATDHFTIPMVLFITVNGYTIRNMDKELMFTEMGINTKGIGRMI